MDRRKFLTKAAGATVAGGVGAAAFFKLLDPRYSEAKAAVLENALPRLPLELRMVGQTGHNASLIAFGGHVVNGESPADAASHVAEAVDRGVNYFDVAPTYGNAEARLGPALKPYRDRVFLACKSEHRDAATTRRLLENSLRLLQTDRLDLYQLHHMEYASDVEAVFAPGGAMEALIEAKAAGKARFLGFSAHGEQAALALLERFPFDAVMFPYNFNTWWNGNFGPEIMKQVQAKRIGNIALKPMLHGRGSRGQWNKAWYTPLDKLDQAALGLRFTANLPVHTMLPPGHWELFKMALDLAQQGAFAPLNAAEETELRKIAAQMPPLFTNV